MYRLDYDAVRDVPSRIVIMPIDNYERENGAGNWRETDRAHYDPDDAVTVELGWGTEPPQM